MSDDSSEAFEKNLKISNLQEKHEVIDTKEVFGDELGDLSGSDDNDTKSEQHEKSVAGAADEDSTHRHESNHEDEEENDANEKARAGDEEEEGEDEDNEERHEDDDDDDDVKGGRTRTVEDDEEGGGGDEGEEAEAEAGAEEEEEEEEAEEIISMQLPYVKTDLSSADLYFVKLPNFLSVEPRPFSHETYEDEMPKGEQLDEEGKTRVRLKVENTIRWKYDKDSEGNVTKASNSRMVKWSDGSMSLYLGNEIFDVYKTQMQGDHNHLFVRQGNWLHGQNVFRTKLTFRPYSTESLTHRKMTMSLVEHGSKTKKVKILTEVSKNPENKRQELLKQEEEKLKAASRRQNQRRRMREKAHARGLTSAYLEDREQSDDEGEISLSEIKNRFRRGNLSQVSMDSTSGDDESERERRLHKAKYSDDEDESARSGHANEDDDDDDDDISSKKAHSSKKKTRKVVSDDED